MRILGIVAEYDPFHLGHLSHLKKAREASGAEYSCVAISSCFLQRGEPSLLSPGDRAACAVLSGADAVFELPAAWTVRDAEHYALGAVSLLTSVGCTHLAFGAECGDLQLLSRLASLLEDPPAGFRQTLRERLDAGDGYPRAAALAAAAALPGAAGLLDSPNNILAVCYLRALRRLNSPMEPVLIRRPGAYHADGIDPEAPSASAVRSALWRGNYGPALAAVPPCTAERLRRAFLDGAVPREAVLDTLLLSALRTETPERLRSLPEVSEGLEHALTAAAKACASRRELLARLTSRRYPASRIRRICAAALLGLNQEALAALPLPWEARLLALRKSPELTARWRDLPIPVTASAGAWKTDPRRIPDLTAWRIRSLLCGQEDTRPFSEPVLSPEP